MASIPQPVFLFEILGSDIEIEKDCIEPDEREISLFS